MRQPRNCKRCGRVFLYAGALICPECLEKEEEQFRNVKTYLDQHPGAGVSETAEGTGVPVEIVVEFLRQGLLVRQDGPGGQLTCMICKRPITRGRICPRCESTLGAEVAKLRVAGKEDVPKTPSAERMYAIDFIGRKRQ